MTEYTPSLDEVRHQYLQTASLNVRKESGADFDRFVAKVQADALREAADARYADEIQGAYISAPTWLNSRADSLHPTVLPAAPVEEES